MTKKREKKNWNKYIPIRNVIMEKVKIKGRRWVARDYYGMIRGAAWNKWKAACVWRHPWELRLISKGDWLNGGYPIRHADRAREIPTPPPIKENVTSSLTNLLIIVLIYIYCIQENKAWWVNFDYRLFYYWRWNMSFSRVCLFRLNILITYIQFRRYY